MARTISDAVTEICSLRHGIENAAWEEARGKLMAYLRLKGSCDGGDQEEYDALNNVIKKFIERIDEDDIYSPDPDEITRLREENARLREALEPFAPDSQWIDPAIPDGRPIDAIFLAGELRAAAAAIREGGNDG